MSSIRFSLAGVFLASVLLVGAQTSDATSSGRNGRITFMRQDAREHEQVWIAGPRLGGAKRLTRTNADSGWSVWSPDGKRLAFTSTRADPDLNDSNEVWDVYTMNADGTAVIKLTGSSGFADDPAWSPDGKQIAFEADFGDPMSKQGIYLMNADGSDVRRVTTLPAGYEYDLAPRFSPNGAQLVFTRFRGKGDAEKAALFTVRPDGTGLQRLTSFAIHAGDADWSPDGRRLAFEAYPNPASYGDIYVVGADGRNLRNLTHNPLHKAGSADPVWAPDGAKLLVLDSRIVGGVGKIGLATMRADGSRRAFVSRSPIESHQPDWESVH